MAYRGDTEQMRQISDISAASLWYFTAGDGESTAEKKCVRVFNYLSGHAISGRKTNSFNATGNDVWIKAHTSGNGVAIDLFNTFNNANATALNNYSGGGVEISLWTANDGGSCFEIISVDDIVEDLKTQYSALVDGCETLTALFSVSDCATAKTAITNATTGLEVITAYETLIATANGKMVSLESHTAEHYISFAVGGGIKAESSEALLKIASKHDLLAIQDLQTGLYIGLCPTSQSTQFTSSSTPEYFQMKFNGSYSGYVCFASSNASTASGTLTMHDGDNGSGNLVTWYVGAAKSFFQPAAKTLSDLKLSIKAKLDAISGWQPIYAAADITTAKSNVDAAATTEAINTIYVNAIKAADGKLLYIENYANAGKYMSINATNVTNRTYPTVIKLLVNDDLSYSLQGYLNFESYYAEQLKNVNYTLVTSSTTAGKYRLGHDDTKGFLFYSTEHTGCLHYSNGNVVRWWDSADASYWKVSDVNDAAYLGSYYNAIQPYQSNYGQYGYYKSGSTTKVQFDNAISGIETILGDLEGQSSSIFMGKTVAKGIYDTGFTPVVPVAGEFLRIKASDTNKTAWSLDASNLYLTSSNSTGSTGRAAFVEGATATDNTTIFYFDGSYLTGLANGLQPTGTGSWAQMSIGTVGATPTKVGFEEIYSTENHAYRVEFSNGGRSMYTNRGGDGSEIPYYYHTDAADGNATDAHYRYFLEKVTSLPITFKGEYASFYSPVDLTIPDNANLKVYTGTMNGNKSYLLLSEITTGTLPANTGVILHLDGWTEETSINFPILSTVASGGEGDLSGTITAASVTANSTLVLGKVKVEEEDVWGIYKYSGTTLGGFKAYMNLTHVTGGEAKGLRFIFEDSETTGINSLAGEQSAKGNSAVYDLQGRKVANPSRGMYIINGRKIVIK